MTGLDTGFFVELLRGESAAVAIWEALIDGNEEATVSCLALLEIERLGMKGAIEGAEVLLEAIPAVCRLVWIEDLELLSSAAGLSHGLGIPAVDALILAGLSGRRPKRSILPIAIWQPTRKAERRSTWPCLLSAATAAEVTAKKLSNAASGRLAPQGYRKRGLAP